MAKVHIVNHTHWDREWYFTTADALALSDNTFTEVLDELEKNKRACFCLDGQTSIIDDYLEIRPERLNQIIRFVKERRLSIGPWYTQTDAFFVNGESIIRNLTLGIRDAVKYGGYMNIGYLPDSFGFNAQMPTILKNCGITNMIFYRGINFEKHVPSPYFIWEGLSGKKVLTVNLIKGYGGAAFLEDHDLYLQNKLYPIVEKIKEMTSSAEIMVPVGEDQLDIVPDLPEKLDSINKRSEDYFEASTYENFLSYLEQQKDLPEYQGEFREPCFARVHKSIGSVRYDIKRINFLLEQKLLNRIEPLMAIGRANHICISEKLLHKAWKKMMETHAHDGMGGCVSDNVAVDIFHRMKEADEIADSIENIISKRLGESIGLSETEVLVYNTLPTAFRGYKKVQIISGTKNVRFPVCEEAMILETTYFEPRENVRIVSSEGEKYITEQGYYKMIVQVKMDLPAMGYKVISFIEDEDCRIDTLEKTEDQFIKNEFYTLSFQGDTLELTTSFGKKISNFITFEDCANDGDTYDFSPLSGDTPLDLQLKMKQVLKSPVMEMMELWGQYELPLNLSDRPLNNGEKGQLEILLSLILNKETDYIECKCVVVNEIYSHRLRIKINTEMSAKETIASLPFGYIRRSTAKKVPDNWRENYVEMPAAIEPFESSVSVEDGVYALTAFGKGMKEYEYIDQFLTLTLFSSTGQLGKENLTYRPGRASGDTTRKGHVMMATPLAQLNGECLFEFALHVHKGSFDGEKTALLWQEYTMEHPSYQMQNLNKFIYRLDNKIQPRENSMKAPKQFSLLSVDYGFLFSSLAPSLYEENGIVLRLKNPTQKDIPLSKVDFEKFSKCTKVNFIEEPCEDQTLVIPAFDSLSLQLLF